MMMKFYTGVLYLFSKFKLMIRKKVQFQILNEIRGFCFVCIFLVMLFLNSTLFKFYDSGFSVLIVHSYSYKCADSVQGSMNYF